MSNNKGEYGVHINIYEYGAVGDGITDDSVAIQLAINDCPTGGVVQIPEGVFACADIQMKPHVTLQGTMTWGYRDGSEGGSCLIPSRDDAACLVDITDAVGCTLIGLSLEGQRRGCGMHGVRICKTDGYGREEDALRVEKCRIAEFSGDALHLEHVWCATVRDNMLCGSRHGLYIDGWDLFIYDNWLTANRECGIYGKEGCNTAIVCQGNRVEWNGREGILSNGGVTWVLNGNHFDRNGREGARFCGSKHINIVGNVFARDGWRVKKDEYSVGLTMERSCGISVNSNVFRSLGGDGKNAERHSPDYDMQLCSLDTAAVSGNIMYQAAVVQNILDHGGHTNLILKDNLGSLAADNC